MKTIQNNITKARRKVPDRIAAALIKRGVAREYLTRDMRAAQPAPAPAVDPAAPYGLKEDGTPRLRPARAPKAGN